MPRLHDLRSYRDSCPGQVPGHGHVHPTHRMRHTSTTGAGLSLVFCKQCGCYGQTRFAKLREVCRGRPTAATTTTTMRKRLMQGKHPLTQVPLSPHVAWQPPQVARLQQVSTSLSTEQQEHMPPSQVSGPQVSSPSMRALSPCPPDLGHQLAAGPCTVRARPRLLL
jgi:hypothetical protein